MTMAALAAGLGLTLVMIGVFMLVRPSAAHSGTNRIRLPWVEAELSTPGLVLVVLGCGMVVIAAASPGAQQDAHGINVDPRPQRTVNAARDLDVSGQWKLPNGAWFVLNSTEQAGNYEYVGYGSTNLEMERGTAHLRGATLSLQVRNFALQSDYTGELRVDGDSMSGSIYGPAGRVEILAYR